MSMNKIVKTLMERDDMTFAEATDLLIEMRGQVRDGEDPEEVLYEIGLEPDYVFDLI